MTFSFSAMAEYPRPAITGKQVITVTNKAQLVAAVGCAMDFPGTTEITLVREYGKTFYVLDGAHDFSWKLERFNCLLKKTRSAIRRLPAEYFK